MTRSGLCSAIFLSAAEPLLTATTSYPASVRIFVPMFWAVMLSSANKIFSGTSNTFKPAGYKQLNAYSTSIQRKDGLRIQKVYLPARPRVLVRSCLEANNLERNDLSQPFLLFLARGVFAVARILLGGCLLVGLQFVRAL